MGVSKNRGKPPKILDGLKWFQTLLKWMIWGYHNFWKHPYIFQTKMHIKLESPHGEVLAIGTKSTM